MNPLPHCRQRLHLRAAALSGTVLLLLLAALGIAGLPLPSSVAAAPVLQSCRDWAVMPVPNIPEKINILNAISASSKDDIWAVGHTKDHGSAENTARTLAMHWDGREWKIVPTPNPFEGNNYLDGVVTLGPNDAWAVGDTGTSAKPGTLLFHWDGTAWTPAQLPELDPSGNALYALAAVAPNDVWAVGVMGNHDFSRAVILHYDGSQWAIHKTFTEDLFPSIMYSVAARSANDVWVVGARGSESGVRGLLAHWDGNTWAILEDNAIGVNLSEAWDVAVAPGAPDVWVAGQHGRARDVAAVIHRGTGEWERDGEDLRVADRNFLRGIVATSNMEVWAVGFGESPNLMRPLMMRTANGTDWTALSGAEIEGSAALYDITSLGGGDLIAVGTANGAALVEMYRDPCAPAPAPATPTPEATQPPAATPTPTRIPTFEPTPIPGDNSRTFPETGKSVRGLFLDYWERNGGLAQQGYPISDMFTEISPLNGKPHTVQYFERAVFEYHPENQPPYDVLLSQLGTFQYKQKYTSGAPGQTPNTSEGSVLFPETGHHVGGKFLEYWQQHGGLAQQGYPISDEFTEVSDLNGQTYLVQYFERAVFELHPENQPPYDVLLSQLGTFQHREKYQAGGPGSTTSAGATPTPDAWAALRRPLDLPSVAHGAPCPVTPSRQIVPAPPASMTAENGIGAGPIYPDAHYFAEGTTLRLRSDMEETPGWFTTKVRWVGGPDYEGPVLVRGRRIDGDGEVRFEFDDPNGRRVTSPEMALEAFSGWNEWPSSTLLPSPGAGCYAYQVDGTTFTDVIVFRAVLEP